MIETIRRGRLSRLTISVAARASVGETIAPRVKAPAHERSPIARCATSATPQVVAATSPIASSEIGRRLARSSRSPVKNADE